MGAAGRARAESVLAWEHQERALLAAYSSALGMGPVRETRVELLRRFLAPGGRSEHSTPGHSVRGAAAATTI